MFEARKIRNLKISISKTEAEVDALDRLIKGTTSVPSYYADKFIEGCGKLAALKKELEIICG